MKTGIENLLNSDIANEINEIIQISDNSTIEKIQILKKSNGNYLIIIRTICGHIVCEDYAFNGKNKWAYRPGRNK